MLVASLRRGVRRANKPEPYRIPFRHVVVFLLAGSSFVAMLAALFFSYSRGAWIGVAAALGVTALLIVVRSRRAATLALVLGLVALIVIGLGEINLVPNIISERFATVGDYFNFEDVRGVRANDENFALVERRAHWQAALDMFEDSPWVGVGFGNYAAAYPAYALPKWDDPLGHAHNYYLNVLAEAGGIGFLAYLVLWGVVFWNVGRAALATGGWQQGVVAGGFGVLVALSIHNFFDNLFVHAMYLQVGMTLGLVTVLSAKPGPVPETRSAGADVVEEFSE
jgi:O-antigen ligase